MTLTFLRGRDVVFFLWQVLGAWTEEKGGGGREGRYCDGAGWSGKAQGNRGLKLDCTEEEKQSSAI